MSRGMKDLLAFAGALCSEDDSRAGCAKEAMREEDPELAPR